MGKIRILILLYLLGTSIVFADKKEGREFIDLPDVDDGYNIHVMYVLPVDGIDKEYDLNSKIGMLVYQMNKWFNSKTKGRLFEEGQKLKFDRKEDNRLDISFLRLDIEDIDISKRGINAVNVLQPAIARFGFNDPKKVISLFMVEQTKMYVLHHNYQVMCLWELQPILRQFIFQAKEVARVLTIMVVSNLNSIIQQDRVYTKFCIFLVQYQNVHLII